MEGRLLGSVVLLTFASSSAGQFFLAACNYSQFVPAGPHAFYVYSPGYPEPYQPPIDCYWVLTSAENSRLVLDCEDVNVPKSVGCKKEYLLVEDSIDSTSDKEPHCGKDSFTVVSKRNQLTISLQAQDGSKGGHFICSLGAQIAQTRMLAQADETASLLHTDQCDCGWSNMFKIVDGTETGVNEFPFMAGLIDSILRHLICGATVITDLYVLTAAHCLQEKQVNQLAVLVGEHDLSNEPLISTIEQAVCRHIKNTYFKPFTDADSKATQLIRVIGFLLHPEYDRTNEVNDIALIKLAKPVKLSDSVGPVCLPFRYSSANFIGQPVTILGWGTTEFGGPPSNYLQKVVVKVVPSVLCLNAYGGKFSPVRGLCTYAQGKDACQADSGGPLLWFDPDFGRYVIVGIVSYGRGCASQVPSANTNVGPFLLWIRQVTRGEFCIK